MRLQRYKRQRYLCASYLGWLALAADALPPLLPTCDRAWQAMAEGTDRQAYSPATRLLAFVLSKCAILEWTATARTTDIIISVGLPTSLTTPFLFAPSSDQTSSKQFSCPCLTALKHLSRYKYNTQPTPTTTTTQQPHNQLSTVDFATPAPIPTASPTARLAQQTFHTLNTTHFRNGRRQHNVLSGAAPFSAASLPRPTTKPPSASSAQAQLNGSKSNIDST